MFYVSLCGPSKGTLRCYTSICDGIILFANPQCQSVKKNCSHFLTFGHHVSVGNSLCPNWWGWQSHCGAIFRCVRISSTYVPSLIQPLVTLSDFHSVDVCGPWQSVRSPWDVIYFWKQCHTAALIHGKFDSQELLTTWNICTILRNIW